MAVAEVVVVCEWASACVVVVAEVTVVCECASVCCAGGRGGARGVWSG